MAKEKETKPQATNVADEIRTSNMLTDTAVKKAMEEIEHEKDEKKKKEAKKALCIATYRNRKKRLQVQQRSREEELTKEDLKNSKDLLERLIGFETEIKDGILVPTKTKIADDKRLTPNEFEIETRKKDEEIDKKRREIDSKYHKDLTELRDSFEGEYRFYIRDWD